MLVQIRDRAALSSLSIVGLRSYLTSHGWSDEGALGKRPATIYAKEHGGRSWELLVPLRFSYSLGWRTSDGARC